MELWSIDSDKYLIYSITEKKGEEVFSPALRFLNCAPADLSAHAKGMRNLFARYAAGGSGNLTRDMFHAAGGDDIDEFRHGRLRIYCFRDPENGNVILLSHGQMKKSGRRGNKTDPADLKKAESARDRYLEAKSKSQIDIKEVPQNEKPQE